MVERNCNCGGELEFEDLNRFRTKSYYRCKKCGQGWLLNHEIPHFGQHKATWRKVNL